MSIPSARRRSALLTTTAWGQCSMLFNLQALGITQRAIFEDSVGALLSDEERAYLASRKGKKVDAPDKVLGAIARLAKRA